MRVGEIKPVPTFGNKIFTESNKTWYGFNIRGKSRGYDYDVHVAVDNRTKKIMHKLYCVTENHKWIKSFLRYFSDNKVHKEIRSINKKCG